jgi:hypothetical protein
VLPGALLLLDYTGRRSGVRHALPAMSAADGDRLVVLAGRPATKTWWRNFGTEGQAVLVTAGGRRRNCQATRPDAATDQYRSALAAYRRRFPRVRVEDGTPLVVLDPADLDRPDSGGTLVPRRRWAELTPRQQTAALVAVSVQLSLAATAWADLATRSADEVNGSRLRWAAVIAVNTVGPLAWFRWGRLPRRHAR